MSDVTLRPVRASDHELLAKWLEEPAVRRTWGDPAEQLAFLRALPERYDHALICADGSPVGYLRWALCDAELLATVGAADLPAGLYDVDLFLGTESDRGRGAGPRALERLAVRLFDAGAPVLSLISHVSNARAHRAFEKAGWTKDRPYRDDTFGDCWLFLRWAPGRAGR